MVILEYKYFLKLHKQLKILLTIIFKLLTVIFKYAKFLVVYNFVLTFNFFHQNIFLLPSKNTHTHTYTYIHNVIC